MPLEGLHHVTAITGDAPANVDFYARVMGLRLVKKTVNFDQPDVYHLYFGDEQGTPGSILTFFEFPGVVPGRAGDGMVHTVQWRVDGPRALDFWAARLSGEGAAVEERQADLLAFADPEGMRHELLAVAVPDAPLVARAPDVPAEHALQGFHGVRAYASRPAASGRLLEALGFEQVDEGGADWQVAGAERQATLRYDAPPPEAGEQAGGTVHHIAWSAADDAELEALRGEAAEGGARPTPIIDRQYFHSVYFREPSGVLLELASRDIGFAYDEPVESLGQALKLPPRYEAHRAELERRLTPLRNPREPVGG
jgi:glyoxalase family protein